MHRPPDEQIVAGRVARNAIALGMCLCEKEVSGTQLDKEIETYIKDNGCFPALKGYKPPFTERIYQHTICLALNNQAVHGVPKDVPIKREDLVTIDLVVGHKGWYADTARTFTFSNNAVKKGMVTKIIAVHTNALGILTPNLKIKIYAEFCERVATEICDVGIVREFCGHGIGQHIHDVPQVPSSFTQSEEIFVKGKAYAIEPIISLNKKYTLVDGDDGWTVSADCLTAHMEDTIFVSDVGVFNLTN